MTSQCALSLSSPRAGLVTNHEVVLQAVLKEQEAILKEYRVCFDETIPWEDQHAILIAFYEDELQKRTRTFDITTEELQSEIKVQQDKHAAV